MPAPQVMSNVSSAAGLKIDPATLKAEGHDVPVDADAKIDIHTVLSNASRIEREKAAIELVDLVKIEGPAAFIRLGLAAAIEKGLTDKKNAVAREGACELLSILVEQGVGNAVEPFFFEKLMHLIVSETFADKVAPVRTAAVAAVKSIVQVSTSWAVPIFLPILLEQIKTAGKWQVKTGALSVIDQLVVSSPDQCARLMPDIIPVMVDAIWGASFFFRSRAALGLRTTGADFFSLTHRHQGRCQEGRSRVPYQALRPRLQQGYREVHPCPHLVPHQPRRGGSHHHPAPRRHHLRFRGRLPHPCPHGSPPPAWSHREAHLDRPQGRCHHRASRYLARGPPGFES